MSATLFDRIGGEAAIVAATNGFYAKVMADPLTAPFFERLDMAAQTTKIVAFLACAMEGPIEYRGRGLREAHADLVKNHGLDDRHFDAIAGHLEKTLVELDVPADVRQQVMALVASTRAEVLSR